MGVGYAGYSSGGGGRRHRPDLAVEGGRASDLAGFQSDDVDLPLRSAGVTSAHQCGASVEPASSEVGTPLRRASQSPRWVPEAASKRSIACEPGQV